MPNVSQPLAGGPGGDPNDFARRVLTALADPSANWDDPQLQRDLKRVQEQLSLEQTGRLDQSTIKALMQMIAQAIAGTGGEATGYNADDAYQALREARGGGLGGRNPETAPSALFRSGRSAPGAAVPAAAQSAAKTPGQPIQGAAPGTPASKMKLTAQSDHDNCGKAAIAMAISGFSGKHESDTQWGEPAISLEGTLKSELGKYGATSRTVPFDRNDFGQIDAALKKGNPVVIGSGFGSPSGFGHFVTLANVRGSGANTEYLVADPNGGKQYWAKQSDIRKAPPHSVANCNVAMITNKG